MQHQLKNGFIISLLCLTSIAHANYRSPSENTELMEDAMSGGAAIAIDASTNFFNPGGLTRIPNPQFVGAVKGVNAETHFKGTSAGLTGSANSNVNALVPALHYSTPIAHSEKLFFGFSITSPFGSSTIFSNDSIVRFVVTKSLLGTIDLGPSIAYRFNEHFSLGAGPDAQYGKLIANVQFPAPPFPINGMLKNDASDWAYGGHIGALYEVNENTRVGLNYRSQFRHRFKGTSTYPGLPNNSNLSVTLPLPAITMLSIYHAINPTWAVLGTIDFTQWAVVKNIVLRNTAVGPLAVIPQNFRNTIRYALGGEYHPNPKWIFRTGLSYEPTPMNSTDRSIVLPVTDNIIFGIGGHYQAFKAVGFDLGYVHVFTKNVNINNTSLGVVTAGKASTSLNAIGAQVTWDI